MLFFTSGRVAGYVEQQDMHSTTVTVREVCVRGKIVL